MNIEFHFNRFYSEEGYIPVCHSTNFPNIHFQKGDTIDIGSFTSFLNKGYLFCPTQENFCDLDEFESTFKIVDFSHVYQEDEGYILIISLEYE